ncbi:hypothetical protein [Neoaquamicrobium sediminum]
MGRTVDRRFDWIAALSVAVGVTIPPLAALAWNLQAVAIRLL